MKRASSGTRFDRVLRVTWAASGILTVVLILAGMYFAKR